MAAQGSRQLKVCLLSLYSYPLFNPACVSPFGGSEVRVSLIAKELAKFSDLDINMVVFDHGQPRREQRCGVTLHSWPGKFCPLRADTGRSELPGDRDSGGHAPAWPRARLYLKAHASRGMVSLVRRLRYPLAPVESAFSQAAAFLRGEPLFGWIESHAIRSRDVGLYDEISADIYLAHGNHDLAAELAFYCRRTGRKCVMLSGSDEDFSPAHALRGSTDLYGSLGFLMAYTIMKSDLIFVQSRHQADMARNHYGRDTIIIPNPVDLAQRFPRAEHAEKILWVGKSDDCVKQPGLFLDLARKTPGYEYLMIMNPAISSVHRRVLQESRELANLSILTYVPYDQVEKYFAQAALLVNTSVSEGFPDTFLQASKYGVPIVSLQVDPGGMISKHGCGLLCGGDFARLAEGVSLLMPDKDRRARVGAHCRAYLARHHDKDELVPKYREAILKL